MVRKSTDEKPLNVRQDPEKPVEREVLAVAIVSISDAMNRLLRSGLNRRAIVALLYDFTKVPKRSIEDVLDGLDELKNKYTSAGASAKRRVAK